MTQDNIHELLSRPIEEILEVKKAYHKEQVEFHSQQILLLNKSMSPASIVHTKTEPKTGESSQDNFIKVKQSKFIFINNGVELEISQLNVKPLVINVFKSYPDMELDNSIIYNKLVEEGFIKENIDKDYRNKWVSCISLSLGHLRETKKIEVTKVSNTHGRKKMYKNLTL
jgi:hypothetical protein